MATCPAVFATAKANNGTRKSFLNEIESYHSRPLNYSSVQCTAIAQLGDILHLYKKPA